MTVYAVEYTYVKNTDALASVRPRHREYLRGLFDAGTLLASGPFPGGSGGALLLFRTDDRTALDAVLANDPFVREQLIERTDVREWDPVIGPWEN